MGRETTMPPKWRELAVACGGVAALAKSLNIATATLSRVSRGEVDPDPDLRRRIVGLAATKRVPTPVKEALPSAEVEPADLRTLELLSKSNVKPPPGFIQRLAQNIGEAKLEKITDSDRLELEGRDVTTAVHSAVTLLHGGL